MVPPVELTSQPMAQSCCCAPTPISRAQAGLPGVGNAVQLEPESEVICPLTSMRHASPVGETVSLVEEVGAETLFQTRARGVPPYWYGCPSVPITHGVAPPTAIQEAPAAGPGVQMKSAGSAGSVSGLTRDQLCPGAAVHGSRSTIVPGDGLSPTTDRQ